MRDEIYPMASKLVYQRAKDLFDVESYEEAIEWLSAAYDMNPESENPLYYLGRSYQEMEKYEEAFESYGKALEVNPNSTLKEMIKEKMDQCKKELPE